jgi:SAM-dependent methyltransferase
MERVNLNTTYKGRWFGQRSKLSWRTVPFCDAIWQTLGPFKTLVDLGCGIGEFVAHFHRNGVFAIGFEGTENCLSYLAPDAVVHISDLREPLHWGDTRFDLCMCLEVAEHIEPDYADTLVNSCCALSDLILFTAAPPGQEGLSHVNLQEPKYWFKKFETKGYIYRHDKVVEFKSLLESLKHKKGIKAYYDNAMVFEKWISP